MPKSSSNVDRDMGEWGRLDGIIWPCKHSTQHCCFGNSNSYQQSVMRELPNQSMFRTTFYMQINSYKCRLHNSLYKLIMGIVNIQNCSKVTPPLIITCLHSRQKKKTKMCSPRSVITEASAWIGLCVSLWCCVNPFDLGLLHPCSSWTQAQQNRPPQRTALKIGPLLFHGRVCLTCSSDMFVWLLSRSHSSCAQLWTECSPSTPIFFLRHL